MRKPKFVHAYWHALLFLFLLAQNLAAQSGPVPINGTIDKPDTKIALYELFYQNIDNNDIDPNEAELNDQFLIVKNHNAQRIEGKLKLDGNKIFTTDLEELPFLPSVSILGNGQIWPTDVEYYYDNYENITSQEELYETVNNANNISVENNCIRFVLNDEEGEFTSGYIAVFEQMVTYLSDVFCCPGSSPVTFVIQPGVDDVQLGAATPQYFSDQVDIQGGCNSISENPFLTGLLGKSQPAIAIIQLNTDNNWDNNTRVSYIINRIK